MIFAFNSAARYFRRLIKTGVRSLENSDAPVFADDFFAHHGLGRQKMYFFNALSAGAGNQNPRSISFVETAFKTV